MVKPLQSKRADARKRTEKWREGRKEKRLPEVRQVDRAIVSALAHMVTREKVDVDRQGMVRLMTLAQKILARHFDAVASAEAIAKRLGSLKKANEIGMLLRWEEEDRLKAQDAARAE